LEGLKEKEEQEDKELIDKEDDSNDRRLAKGAKS